MKLFLLLLLTPTFVMAMGLLPAQSTTTVRTQSGPVLVGEKVPLLVVVDDLGKKRALLSYKSSIEVLSVIFMSAECPAAQMRWTLLRRLQENYSDWRVKFIVVNTGAPEKREALAAAVKREGLRWPVVNDDEQTAISTLKVTGTPMVMVIDEYAMLRYRGPVKPMPNVLDTVISHIDPVREPEPALEDACGL